MARYDSCMEILCAAVFLTFLILIPYPAESASIRTSLDAKYTRTNTSKPKTDKSIEKTLIQEYNPRLNVQYSHPLTEWTVLSSEAKLDYKKEDKSTASDTESTESDIKTREPQIELRLKSLIYDFKTGFKETWNRNQTEDEITEKTENRAFGHLLIQPLELPELRIDYDHDKSEGQFEKDKMSLGTIYKPSGIFRIKLDFKHEFTDYVDSSDSDIEDMNLSGEMKLNYTLSTRSPLKVEVSYKAESIYKENKETKNTPKDIERDELLQTFRGKLRYKPTIKTDLSLEYESKIKDDQEGSQDNVDQDIQFDLSQKLADWLSLAGRIRKESEEEMEETGHIVDTDKTTSQGQIRVEPTDWFRFTFKVIDEDEETEEKDPNTLPGKTSKTTYEASLRSDFPNFLRSSQTLDYKTETKSFVSEEETKEESFMWKWSLRPMDNLFLKPEYIHSITQNIKEEKKETTNEYKLNMGYRINLNETWDINLSHITNRKRINENQSSEITTSREINDDSSLEVDFQPFESLFMTSQITRKDYKITGNNPSEREEKSYSFKYDWAFPPFTWSTSYKYDDKKQDNDTETFESKINCDFSDYTLEAEYKFTQTFIIPQEDKEEVITLRFKAVF